MRGAVPCLSADLTTHAVSHFMQALKMGRRAAPKVRGAGQTPWPQGRWQSYARRRALLACGSDNPRRATLYTGFGNGKARGAGDAEQFRSRLRTPKLRARRRRWAIPRHALNDLDDGRRLVAAGAERFA